MQGGDDFPPLRMVVLVGIPGSGKSTFSERMEGLGWAIVNQVCTIIFLRAGKGALPRRNAYVHISVTIFLFLNSAATHESVVL